jgi:transcriptional regulator with XRE-family HTH domain
VRCPDRASQPADSRRTFEDVDNRAEVREFLTSRRAKVTPTQVGLAYDGRRRVPGLRRTEVATLAGVSIEYYSRLERGALAGVSASVLDAIAKALQLDPAERAHLFHLAQAADGTSALMRPRRRATTRWTARPGLQWVLDAITAGPAFIGNSRQDLLATNHLARALYSDMFADPTTPPNFARYAFLDTASHRFYPDWDLAADTAVAMLRTSAGQDPHDKQLHDLVGELSTRSEEFRRRWSAHNVRIHGGGIKHFHHHVVGDLTLAYETVDLTAEPGLGMAVYAAEPASPSEDGLRLLAAWAATLDPHVQDGAPLDSARHSTEHADD